MIFICITKASSRIFILSEQTLKIYLQDINKKNEKTFIVENHSVPTHNNTEELLKYFYEIKSDIKK